MSLLVLRDGLDFTLHHGQVGWGSISEEGLEDTEQDMGTQDRAWGHRTVAGDTGQDVGTQDRTWGHRTGAGDTGQDMGTQDRSG